MIILNMIQMNGKYTNAKIMIDNVEETCVGQITQFINNPVFTNPVAIMPDTHAGKGSVIGFTMELTNKIVPNVVGVDVSCGMLTCNIGKKLDISLDEFDRKIRQQVPFGQNVHERSVIHMKNDFPWHDANVLAQKFFAAFNSRVGIKYELEKYDIDWLTQKCKILEANFKRVIDSVGTLGGGNHFIETGVSTKGDVWITIHSGSRNFGKKVCEYWQNKAIKKLKKTTREDIQNKIIELRQQYKGDELYHKIQEAKKGEQPTIKCPEELMWLENEDMAGYLFDMIFCQLYAHTNRLYMMNIITDILKVTPLEMIETIHNFIDFNDFIIRKGAIRSYKNEKMIIPFNMRDGILLCEGQSNPEWNFSAPHGAGRVMSRSQAKRELNIDEFKKQMTAVFSTSVGRSTLDEAPNAYKDARIIEEAIAPTAIILDKIKPIHNMKDGEGISIDG